MITIGEITTSKCMLPNTVRTTTITRAITISYYIVFPRNPADISNGRSRVVDELIRTASLHRSEVNNEIWGW